MYKNLVAASAFLMVSVQTLSAAINDQDKVKPEPTKAEINACRDRNALAFHNGAFQSMVKGENKVFGFDEMSGVRSPAERPRIFASALSVADAREAKKRFVDACRANPGLNLLNNAGPLYPLVKPDNFKPNAKIE